MGAGLTLDLSGVVNEAIEVKLKELGLEDKINDALGLAVQKASKMITVTNAEGTTTKMGVQHKQFETILKLISMGENLMIKGEAGNGKSHVVAEVAKALNLPFHSMSVSNQTTKTDLMGFVDAQGVYRYNGFISAFRDGGIFNMDEIDAGNANVLVVLNSALSNGFVETPAGEMIYKHENFRFCATANTVGTGATSKYVGRNKLDSATLDRFAVIHFELDDAIELMLCGGDEVYHKPLKKMRELANKNYEEVLISQRSATRLKNLLENGFDVDEALDIAVFKGVDEDICTALRKEFKKHHKVKKVESKVVTPVEEPKAEEPKAEELPPVTDDEPETAEKDDFDW